MVFLFSTLLDIFHKTENYTVIPDFPKVKINLILRNVLYSSCSYSRILAHSNLSK